MMIGSEVRGQGHRSAPGLVLPRPGGETDISDRLLRLGLRLSAAGIGPAASIRTELTGNVEDLRNGLSASNRRRTRRWVDRGVMVRLGSGRDLPPVADLLVRTAAHQRFDALSLNYLRTLYRELDCSGYVKVFIGELDGVAAVAEVFTGGGGMLDVATGRDAMHSFDSGGSRWAL
jgi:hypothetical protein